MNKSLLDDGTREKSYSYHFSASTLTPNKDNRKSVNVLAQSAFVRKADEQLIKSVANGKSKQSIH